MDKKDGMKIVTLQLPDEVVDRIELIRKAECRTRNQCITFHIIEWLNYIDHQNSKLEASELIKRKPYTRKAQVVTG